MNVHFYKRTLKGFNSFKELFAEVELEVVSEGTYVIDDVEYTTVGKPVFHIKKTTSIKSGRPGRKVDYVDIMVVKV